MALVRDFDSAFILFVGLKHLAQAVTVSCSRNRCTAAAVEHIPW